MMVNEIVIKMGDAVVCCENNVKIDDVNTNNNTEIPPELEDIIEAVEDGDVNDLTDSTQQPEYTTTTEFDNWNNTIVALYDDETEEIPQDVNISQVNTTHNISEKLMSEKSNEAQPTIIVVVLLTFIKCLPFCLIIWLVL